MNEDKTPKGTTWKRRRAAAIAGVALTALTAIGAATMTGNASAASGWGGKIAPVVQPAKATGPTPAASTGWGG
jgi:hypothetical protein